MNQNVIIVKNPYLNYIQVRRVTWIYSGEQQQIIWFLDVIFHRLNMCSNILNWQTIGKVSSQTLSSVFGYFFSAFTKLNFSDHLELFLTFVCQTSLFLVRMQNIYNTPTNLINCFSYRWEENFINFGYASADISARECEFHFNLN